MAKEKVLSKKVFDRTIKIVGEINNLMGSENKIEELTVSAIAVFSSKIAELQIEIENLKCYVYKD